MNAGSLTMMLSKDTDETMSTDLQVTTITQIIITCREAYKENEKLKDISHPLTDLPLCVQLCNLQYTDTITSELMLFYQAGSQ